MSQFVPLGAAQRTELQQRYESLLKDYDSSRVHNRNRIQEAMSDLLRMSQGGNGGSNKWLRPSVPAIKNSSNRIQRPYANRNKTFRIRDSSSNHRTKTPPISRQTMGILRIGDSPFKPVKPATEAINQPHAVMKAYTESITTDYETNDSNNNDDDSIITMVSFIQTPAVYRKVTLIQ